MLNTYIYHPLPPTCFSVSYTIVRDTIALFAQELYTFLQRCYIGCAINYKVHSIFLIYNACYNV